MYSDEEFKEIYTRYNSMIYRISLMFLKNPQDAQDLVQTVFIKLLKHKKGFQGEEHLKAWLIVVTQNSCKNILSNWWRRQRVDLDKSGEGVYFQDFHKAYVWDEICKLPDKYKLIIYLYYYEGYGSREIGQMLRLKDSTIRSRLFTARKLLEPLLREVAYEY